MSDTRPNIVDIAKDFKNKVKLYQNHREVSEEIEKLKKRFKEIDAINLQAHKLVHHYSILSSYCELDINKRKLKQRRKQISKILENANISSVILEHKGFNSQEFKNTLGEIETTLQKNWRSYIDLPKNIKTLVEEVLEDPEENQPKVKQLYDTLLEQVNKLPADIEDVNTLQEVKNELSDICEKWEKLDEEVQKFITSIRKGGISLHKVLNEPKIINWLQKDERAKAYLVTRK
ncbi:hypothetical protein [Candidatus Uabimicrobium amorphum]|uniref:Uncharacterized protein n=1 Tax=Uabimicrobium amorphum TaxID=2596890 RepID=A0A5S9F686_UABAM|nr:hypothetical protein [Candidatus Uabimicrobium amorphum]BBM87121.1 hypothetical protein UABAM_05524 [Candidatus Uabimicrobium amorphum]